MKAIHMNKTNANGPQVEMFAVCTSEQDTESPQKYVHRLKQNQQLVCPHKEMARNSGQEEKRPRRRPTLPPQQPLRLRQLQCPRNLQPHLNQHRHQAPVFEALTCYLENAEPGGKEVIIRKT